jgi:hypothetical protein
MAAHRKLWHKGLQRCALLTRKLGLETEGGVNMSRQDSGPTPTGDFLAPRKQGRWLVGVRICPESTRIISLEPDGHLGDQGTGAEPGAGRVASSRRARGRG